MPNGAHEPSCYICNFYASHPHRRCCKKHDFVMPAVGYEIICKDWQPNEAHRRPPYDYSKFPYSENYELMKPGGLYYYSYAVREPFEPLDSCHNLQNLFMDISIHNDQEFGWIGYIWDNKSNYFPTSGSINLKLNSEEYIFEIRNIIRDRTLGDTQERLKRIMHCPLSRDALSRWFNLHFDIDALLAYYKQHQYGRVLLSMGFFVFVEVLQDLSAYSLRPINLQYKAYKR